MIDEWYQSLEKTILSPFAPKWNTIIGDRITKEDFTKIKYFEEILYQNRNLMEIHPNEPTLNFVRNLRFYSPFFYERLKNISIEKHFSKIPFMTREDLQTKITEILPLDLPLDRLIINPTSGTTGKPILAPNHPYAIGCYVPLIEYSLSKHGVQMTHHHKNTTAIQLCHQNATIVYATCHSLAGGAKFAKINLKDADWKVTRDKEKFIQEQAPTFLSGDPYAFETAMKIGISYFPKVLHSTALELEDSLRLALTKHFRCNIINFYSLNETGPIGYSCPLNPEWLHILPHDVFIETVDENGEHSKLGEIVVTGGRNPFLPLLRYKTGDFGELNFSPCNCGEVSPRLKILKGRKPIYFSDTNGNKINPVDISRILRMDANILRHQFIQKKNGGYELNLSCQVQPSTIHLTNLNSKFKDLLGSEAEIHITNNLSNDEKKIMIFINENLNL
jgi:phenylacetate-CoA ligase